MVLRSVIKRSVALLASSILLTGAVFALAGPQRWIPLTQAEMAGHRGSNPDRGTFTDTCNHYQAVIGQPGTWSCVGETDGTGCSNCEVTTNITYADMGGTPKNQKDGAAQNCGRKTKTSTAKCKNGVCVGNTWDPNNSCAQPSTSINQ